MRPHCMHRQKFSGLWVGLALLLGGVLAGLFTVSQQRSRAQGENPTAKREAIPQANSPFKGVAKRTLSGSRPDFPQSVSAPKDAPNVLLILVDDAGFGNPSTFGDPCQTPTLTRLANQGCSGGPLRQQVVEDERHRLF